MEVVEEAMARLAILEDVGNGDLTEACVPPDKRATAVITARQRGIASGIGVAARVFLIVDGGVTVAPRLKRGEPFAEGEEIVRATGHVRSLLTAERSALNFLQRLSGIATVTAQFVNAVSGTGVRITDTRKTTPGLRLLEKEAVCDGGGINHRLGLYDAVMIKDNHIDAAGGIEKAVEAVRAANSGVPIVVEARTQAEAEVAAHLGVGRILLDNMTPAQIAACVRSIRAMDWIPKTPISESRWIAGTWRPGDSTIQIEVSGGITIDNVRTFALPGVDFISVGAITHSAPACDLAMDLILER